MMKRVRPRLVRQLKLRLQVLSHPTSNFELHPCGVGKSKTQEQYGHRVKGPRLKVVNSGYAIYAAQVWV